MEKKSKELEIHNLMEITFGRAIQALARCVLGPFRFCTTTLRMEVGKEMSTEPLVADIHVEAALILPAPCTSLPGKQKLNFFPTAK